MRLKVVLWDVPSPMREYIATACWSVTGTLSMLKNPKAATGPRCNNPSSSLRVSGIPGMARYLKWTT